MGSHIIVGYKTAKHTGNQDALYPQYEAQLNAYARIGEERGFAPVSDLALIYMEPVTGNESVATDESRRGDGFAMGFFADIVPVPVQPEILRPLLATTRKVDELERSRAGRPGCKDCALTARLVDVL